MNIEEVAKIENCLRHKNGLKNIYNIDSLIVLDSSTNSNHKLKKAVEELLPIAQFIEEDVREIWETSFAKQVRQSVDRFKKKKEQ